MHRQSPGLPLEERFWSKVDQSAGLFSCWPWTGARDRDGYGVLGNGRHGPQLRANRLSLELSLGRPLGLGMHSLHRCDNPPCVNPSHLFEGTQAENVADMFAKGRARPGRGIGRAPGGLLTPERVVALRVAARTQSLRQVAALFGVSKSQAHRIATGKQWANVPQEVSHV